MPEISSTKSFTGHTTSASGSIETVICLLAMQNNFTPANLKWKNKIPEGIIPTLGTNDIELNNVICNSFGFGGQNASLVFKKYEKYIVISFVVGNACIFSTERGAGEENGKN